MNLIIENDRERILLVCMHEVGHFVLSKVMGFETTGISVQFERYGGHLGHSGFKSWNPYMDSLIHMKSFLEKRVKILYAGVIAECIDKEGKYDSNKAKLEWDSGGGRDDFSRIRELVRLIRDIESPDTLDEKEVNKQLKALDDNLINETGIIVFEKIDVIREIALFLANKVKDYGINYTLTEDQLNGFKSIKDLNKK